MRAGRAPSGSHSPPTSKEAAPSWTRGAPTERGSSCYKFQETYGAWPATSPTDRPAYRPQLPPDNRSRASLARFSSQPSAHALPVGTESQASLCAYRLERHNARAFHSYGARTERFQYCLDLSTSLAALPSAIFQSLFRFPSTLGNRVYSRPTRDGSVRRGKRALLRRYLIVGRVGTVEQTHFVHGFDPLLGQALRSAIV